MKTLVLLAALLPSFAVAALVDPALQNFARGVNGTAKVLVLMEFRPSRALPARANARIVRDYLVNETRLQYQRVQNAMMASGAASAVRVTTVHSINQAFEAFVSPAGLRALANTAGVYKIYADARVGVQPPVERRPAIRRFESGMPYDLAIMGLDQVYQSEPGLNGTGVLVGHIDTGVDGRHPALAGKIATFLNAGQGRTAEPTDEGSHGTHTAGTILGNPKDGFPMGVAPGAKLVAAAGLTDYESMIKAMEWMMDPDGRPETNDVPRLVSNSWNCGGAPDIEPFYRAISAWEAAGIFTVFSAGNAGPSPRSITKPHEHPLSFSVAAFGPGGKIADFSSRGPGIFQGKETQKPDVAAPGVDVVSSVPGGRYESMSGTSMAAPHAAGLAALLYQINPSLTPAQMRDILTQSSNYVDERGNDIPAPRWNPVYGYGRLNAVKAVAAAKNLRLRLANRWSVMMTPAVDLVEGLGAVAAFVSPEPTSSNALMMAFPTDASG